jgi:hypothetical protein
MCGSADEAFDSASEFVDELVAAGWPATFTGVEDAPHDWLWRESYGHSNDELWDWFMSNPLPN